MRNERFELSDLMRKLANLVRPGLVYEVRHQPYAVRVQIGELITGWLTPLVERAGNNQSWDPLEVGEQVMVISPDGNLAQGWVLGAGYTDSHPAPGSDPDKRAYKFKDGAVIEYDRENHKLKAILPEGATTELVSTGGINFKGPLFVDGPITSTQDITDKTRSMDADRQIYNGHTHPGITPGPGSTGSTGAQQ